MGSFYDDPKPFYEFAHDFIGFIDPPLTKRNVKSPAVDDGDGRFDIGQGRVNKEKIQPTTAHRFLSALERSGDLKGVVTQNIDGLHHKAGSKIVYEMHGSFRQGYCIECGAPFTYQDLRARMRLNFVPQCNCGGAIKPDIVFFGENVKCYAESAQLALGADLLMVIGSSCAVYPAASLPALVPGKIIIINQGQVNLNLYNVALEVQADADQFLSQVFKVLNLGA